MSGTFIHRHDGVEAKPLKLGKAKRTSPPNARDWARQAGFRAATSAIEWAYDTYVICVARCAWCMGLVTLRERGRDDQGRTSGDAEPSVASLAERPHVPVTSSPQGRRRKALVELTRLSQELGYE